MWPSTANWNECHPKYHFLFLAITPMLWILILVLMNGPSSRTCFIFSSFLEQRLSEKVWYKLIIMEKLLGVSSQKVRNITLRRRARNASKVGWMKHKIELQRFGAFSLIYYMSSTFLPCWEFPAQTEMLRWKREGVIAQEDSRKGRSPQYNFWNTPERGVATWSKERYIYCRPWSLF